MKFKLQKKYIYGLVALFAIIVVMVTACSNKQGTYTYHEKDMYTSYILKGNDELTWKMKAGGITLTYKGKYKLTKNKISIDLKTDNDDTKHIDGWFDKDNNLVLDIDRTLEVYKKE